MSYYTLTYTSGAVMIVADRDEALDIADYHRSQGREVAVTDENGAEVLTDVQVFGIQRAARLSRNDLVALAAQFRGEPLTYGATTGRRFRARVAAGLPGLIRVA